MELNSLDVRGRLGRFNIGNGFTLCTEHEDFILRHGMPLNSSVFAFMEAFAQLEDNEASLSVKDRDALAGLAKSLLYSGRTLDIYACIFDKQEPEDISVELWKFWLKRGLGVFAAHAMQVIPVKILEELRGPFFRSLSADIKEELVEKIHYRRHDYWRHYPILLTELLLENENDVEAWESYMQGGSPSPLFYRAFECMPTSILETFDGVTWKKSLPPEELHYALTKAIPEYLKARNDYWSDIPPKMAVELIFF